MRKSLFIALVLAAALSAALSEANAANFFRRELLPGDNILPENGALPGLTRLAKPVTYRGNNFAKYYGAAGNRFVQYGMESLVVCEYTLGDRDHRVTVELAGMDSPTAAAGIFHYHRAYVAAGPKPVEVGAEAVLDISRGGRNLYFYRSDKFFKLIYSGPEPVPDLLPLARVIDNKLPKNRDANPMGFEYIRIEGVNANTIQLTPGFTFTLSILPPAVWASAPGGGSPASDLFVITAKDDKAAAELMKDYASYLRFNAEYIEEYRKGNIRYVKSVDPNQGRVLFTAYRDVFIIAARPDGYEKGEVLIEAVMAKIDATNPGGKRGRK